MSRQHVSPNPRPPFRDIDGWLSRPYLNQSTGDWNTEVRRKTGQIKGLAIRVCQCRVVRFRHANSVSRVCYHARSSVSAGEVARQGSRPPAAILKRVENAMADTRYQLAGTGSCTHRLPRPQTTVFKSDSCDTPHASRQPCVQGQPWADMLVTVDSRGNRLSTPLTCAPTKLADSR